MERSLIPRLFQGGKTLHLQIVHEHINLAPMVCACKGHVRMMTYNKARIVVALSDMHEQNN